MDIYAEITNRMIAELDNGVQLMKEIPGLEDTLDVAIERGIFGTKMRSVIKEANAEGIKEIVKQQFDIAKVIAAKGLVPIIEPEVDINAPDKEKCEEILRKDVMEELALLPEDTKVMFKFTIPSVDNYYKEVMEDKHVVKVVALSGGYEREDACERLARNEGMIASFSRALLEGLKVSEHMKDILKEGDLLFLEFDVQMYDKYDRVLAYAYFDDMTMIQEYLLENGLAQVMTIQPNSKYSKRFVELEQKAIKNGVGIWYNNNEER